MKDLLRSITGTVTTSVSRTPAVGKFVTVGLLLPLKVNAPPSHVLLLSRNVQSCTKELPFEWMDIWDWLPPLRNVQPTTVIVAPAQTAPWPQFMNSVPVIPMGESAAMLFPMNVQSVTVDDEFLT